MRYCFIKSLRLIPAIFSFAPCALLLSGLLRLIAPKYPSHPPSSHVSLVRRSRGFVWQCVRRHIALSPCHGIVVRRLSPSFLLSPAFMSTMPLLLDLLTMCTDPLVFHPPQPRIIPRAPIARILSRAHSPFAATTSSACIPCLSTVGRKYYPFFSDHSFRFNTSVRPTPHAFVVATISPSNFFCPVFHPRHQSYQGLSRTPPSYASLSYRASTGSVRWVLLFLRTGVLSFSSLRDSPSSSVGNVRPLSHVGMAFVVGPYTPKHRA
ncbi:hypothetical protein TRVL_04153 [Trypanosoma vivax]|nr:hypothetical protein TRVL_04153 [Trypanosoma vivax]